MIKVHLQGRTGNQMFQFAFAKLLAQQLNTSALLDLTDEPLRLNFFDLPSTWSVLHNKFAGKVYNWFQKYLSASNELIDVRDCFLELDCDKFVDQKNYKGYFQDHRFYEGHKQTLRKWFSVKKQYRNIFENKYLPKLKNKKSIVVHFRLGDYNSFEPFFVDGKPPIVPTDWYYEILKKFDKSLYDVYCISDDIKTVMQQFKPAGFNVEYVQEDVATDFLMLNHADVCIISNSTFAWWGAFLNSHAEIICPKYFLGLNLGKEYPPHIYPSSWKKIPISANTTLNV